MAKESKSGGKYNEDSTYRTMPIGETQLQVLTADSTKAAISKIAQETNKTNKKLLESIEGLSRTVEVLSKASNKVGLDQSYRLLREDLSKIVSRSAWDKEGVVKEDKEFFKILEKFVSGAHVTTREDGREPGKAVEPKDLKSFEDHIARLLKDFSFSDNDKALTEKERSGINKEKDETKNLYEWNQGLSKFLESIGQGDKAKDQQASADKKFEVYKKIISYMFDKLNGIPTPLSEGFKKSLPNTSNKNDDVLETVDPDPNAQSQEQIVKEQMKAQKAQDSEKKRKGRSKVVKETTSAEGTPKVVKETTSAEGTPKVVKETTSAEEDPKKKDANTIIAEAVRTLFDRYLNTSIVTQEKQKIADYAKENPDAMDNDFFLKVAKSSAELSKYLKNPEGGKVRDFEKILKDSVVDVLKGMGAIPLSRGEKRDVESAPPVVKEIVEKATTTVPSKEKAPAPSKVKENAKEIVEKATTTVPSKEKTPAPSNVKENAKEIVEKATTTVPSKEKTPAPSNVKENAKEIVEKATTTDFTQTSLLDFIPEEKSTSKVEGEPGLSPITPQNMLDINGMLKEAVSNIETSLIDMLDRTGNKFAEYMQNAMDNLSSMFSEGGDLIHDSGSSGESSSYSSSEESKGQRAKTELPSDTSPKPPFRDAISKIMAGEPESPINSIGRVTSLFPDILARKDDGPINQKEKIDGIRKSITDKKGEPESEGGYFADIIKRFKESMSNLKTIVWPKDSDGQPRKLGEATKDAFDTTSKERDKDREDSTFAKLFEFIGNAKSDPRGTFKDLGEKVTDSLLLQGESEGMAEGLGAMVSGIGIVIAIIQKLAESSPILKAVLELFNLAFTLFMMPFGNMIGEWLLPLAMKLIDYAVKFNEVFPKIREAFAGFKDWLFAIPGRILEGLKEYIRDLIASYQALFGKIGETLNGVKDYIFELPGKIGEKLTELKDKIVEKLTEAKDYIFELPGKILEGIKWYIQSVIAFYTGIFGKIVETLTGVKDYIFGLPGKILEGIKWYIQSVIGVYKALFGKIGEILTKVKDYIFGLPKKIWESLKGGAQYLITAIKDAVKGFFEKPKEAINKVKNTVSGAGDKVKNTLGGIGDSVKGLFGYAGGGYIPASPGGSIVRVGEGTRGEYIIPEGSSMLGGSGGQTINITFSGNVYGMRDFEDRVTEIVNKTSNKAYYR